MSKFKQHKPPKNVYYYNPTAIPDSKHNLAKMLENDMYRDDNCRLSVPEAALALYCSAASSGYNPSLIVLGRKLLVGDGLEKNINAGKRFLHLAAHSGDCDAQMIVGMLHTMPAYNCYDLSAAEYWLRCCVLGGKIEAEVLLVRVCYQMKHLNIMSLPSPIPNHTNTALAAKQRGDDYTRMGFYGSAIQEYSRAIYLSPQEIKEHQQNQRKQGNVGNVGNKGDGRYKAYKIYDGYLIDRMEALYRDQNDRVCIQECLVYLLQYQSGSESANGSTSADSTTTNSNSNTDITGSTAIVDPTDQGQVEVVEWDSDMERVMGLLALSVSAHVDRCNDHVILWEVLRALKHGLKGYMVNLGVMGDNLGGGEAGVGGSTELRERFVRALLLLLVDVDEVIVTAAMCAIET